MFASASSLPNNFFMPCKMHIKADKHQFRHFGGNWHAPERRPLRMKLSYVYGARVLSKKATEPPQKYTLKLKREQTPISLLHRHTKWMGSKFNIAIAVNISQHDIKMAFGGIEHNAEGRTRRPPLGHAAGRELARGKSFYVSLRELYNSVVFFSAEVSCPADQRWRFRISTFARTRVWLRIITFRFDFVFHPRNAERCCEIWGWGGRVVASRDLSSLTSSG